MRSFLLLALSSVGLTSSFAQTLQWQVPLANDYLGNPSANYLGHLGDIEISPVTGRINVLRKDDVNWSSNFSLASYSSNGTLLWHNVYSVGPLANEPYTLTLGEDDANYLAGSYNSNGARGKLVCKIGTSGVLDWFYNSRLTGDESDSYVGRIIKIGETLCTGGFWQGNAGQRGVLFGFNASDGTPLYANNLFDNIRGFAYGYAAKNSRDQLLISGTAYDHPSGYLEAIDRRGADGTAFGSGFQGVPSRLQQSFVIGVNDADSILTAGRYGEIAGSPHWRPTYRKTSPRYDASVRFDMPFYSNELISSGLGNGTWNVVCDDYGNAIFATETHSTITGTDLTLMCFDPKMNLKWRRVLDYGEVDFTPSEVELLKTFNGYSYIVVNATTGTGTDVAHLSCIDDKTGEVKWEVESNIRSVSPYGGSSALEIDNSGGVYWAGNFVNTFGQVTPMLRKYLPEAPRNDVRCLLGFGSNISGILGIGSESPAQIAIPTQISGHRNLESIAAGSFGAVSAVADHCKSWGFNDRGQLMDNSTVTKIRPEPVTGEFQTKTLVAGENHGVCRRADGEVFAWGDNSYGQIANGSAIQPEWIRIAGPTNAIGAGYNTTFYINDNDLCFATGQNNAGQLGDGTFVGRAGFGYVRKSATTVFGNIRAATGGRNHSLFLDWGNRVWGTGSNTNGQLGDTAIGVSTQYVKLISNFTNVKSIACGEYSSYAVKNDGTLWAWGANNRGQLGDGTTTRRLTPVQIMIPGTVTQVSAGKEHCLALTSDGFVYSWGANSQGQLGNGTLFDSRIPTRVRGIFSAKIIEAGSNQSYVEGQYLTQNRRVAVSAGEIP
ncbi:MAG: hypothetical protein K8R88_06900 [Armatimonadetes bacterium]|nr:hypothetical protein [Armatimonadota bacterium]